MSLTDNLIHKLNEKKVGFVEVNEEFGFSFVPRTKTDEDSKYYEGIVRESFSKTFNGIWIANTDATLE
jgi:hypothetical protein